MEVKINKEIRGYSESLFFGLTTRQFFCAFLAVGISVGLYFGLKNHINKEVVSWICVIAAAPIATAGFFKYNSLNLEQFIWAFLKSEFICSGQRPYAAENYYYLLLDGIANKPQQQPEPKKKQKKKRVMDKGGNNNDD